MIGARRPRHHDTSVWWTIRSRCTAGAGDFGGDESWWIAFGPATERQGIGRCEAGTAISERVREPREDLWRRRRTWQRGRGKPVWAPVSSIDRVRRNLNGERVRCG